MAGNEYAGQLIDNLDHSKAVLLLLSKASNDSPHVLREIEYAVSQKIPIVVYPLEDVDLSKSMKYYLMTHQWIPESNDREGLLINSLKKIISPNADTDDSDISKNITNPNPVAATAPATEKKEFNILKLIIPLCILIIIFSTPIFIFVKNKVSSNITYNTGDTLIFGEYKNEPIVWRVLKINDDGTLVLISKNILCMKVFDAAEGGEYNRYDGINYWSFEYSTIDDDDLSILVRGNGDWSESNIRTWLNSDNEVVNYPDQAPNFNAVGDTAYDSEAGFLSGFTADEKSAIIPVTNETTTYKGKISSEDLVYLLSSEDLSLLTDADISIYAQPTDSCANDSRHNGNYDEYRNTYNSDDYYWWLRDGGTSDPANRAYCALTSVESGELYISDSVGICAYGIRPAITIKPNQKIIMAE